MPDYDAYQKSISNELLSIKDRVRNFIDDKHWPEDGRYKEIILSHVLKQHLPESVSVGTGFVINHNKELNNKERTSQIDIIVYRSDFPLMFKQDDFIIASPESVLGIIEVKSRIDTYVGKNAIEKATENGRIIGKKIFNGIFAFEFENQRIRGTALEDELAESRGVVNYLCFGKDIFLKYWKAGQPDIHPRSKNSYTVYGLEDLSFGYFISNLIEDVHLKLHGQNLSSTLYGMLYPIRGTKESYNIGEIVVREEQEDDELQ